VIAKTRSSGSWPTVPCEFLRRTLRNGPKCRIFSGIPEGKAQKPKIVSIVSAPVGTHFAALGGGIVAPLVGRRAIAAAMILDIKTRDV